MISEALYAWLGQTSEEAYCGTVYRASASKGAGRKPSLARHRFEFKQRPGVTTDD